VPLGPQLERGLIVVHENASQLSNATVGYEMLIVLPVLTLTLSHPIGSKMPGRTEAAETHVPSKETHAPAHQKPGNLCASAPDAGG